MEYFYYYHLIRLHFQCLYIGYLNFIGFKLSLIFKNHFKIIMTFIFSLRATFIFYFTNSFRDFNVFDQTIFAQKINLISFFLL